jgi:hypothetical protein
VSTIDIPELIENYAVLRDRRLEAQREVDNIAKLEGRAKDELIAAMQESGLTHAGGKDHKVSLKMVDKPVAGDWALIYDYIQENQAFDLLQRRLTEKAIKDRWEDGLSIPGVVRFPVEKLTVSKA